MTSRSSAVTRRDLSRALWPLVRPRLWALTGVMVLFLAQSLTMLAIPLLIGELIDGVARGDTGIAWQVIVGLIGIALASGTLTWLSAWGLTHTVESIFAGLREEFVRATLRLPHSVFEATGGGDLLTRASDDVSQLSENTPTVLPRFLSIVMSSTVIGLGLGLQDWRFLAALLVVVPLLLLTLRWYLRIGPDTYASERQAQAERGRHILDTFRARETVQAYGLERSQIERVRRSSWEHVRWEMRTRIVQNILLARVSFTEFAGLASVLLIGTWIALSGDVTIGTVTAATLLFLRVMEPLGDFLMITDELQSALSSLSRIIGIVSLAHEDDTAAAPMPPGSALVSLSNVDFTYPGAAEALRDVSVRLHEGEHVALVGATGSGKSTLGMLIAGILSPTHGTRTAGIQAGEIVSVAQETHVFAASLRENLTLVAPTADDETIRAALHELGADDLIANCPAGLDTRIGRDGDQLGPTAAAQLALARLYLARPRLAILDEATAEAGSSDATRLERTARIAIGSGAALVVAHRLSQAAECDHILVLDQGRIIEQGSHKQLLASGGRYAQLWHIWSMDR